MPRYAATTSSGRVSKRFSFAAGQKRDESGVHSRGRSGRRRPIAGDLKNDPLNRSRGVWLSHNQTMEELRANQGSMREIASPNWNSVPEIKCQLSKVQSQGLQHLLSICAKQGIQLCLMASPLPEIANTQENLGELQALTDELKSLISKFDQASLAEPMGRFFANDECSSLSHLHPTGVAKNTNEVAETLKAVLRVK